MPKYRPGQHFSIRIEDAELVSLTTRASDNTELGTFHTNVSGLLAPVTFIVPMALAMAHDPAEWPPRAGDIWVSDADHHRWFFYLDHPAQVGDGPKLNLRNELGEFVDGRGTGQTPAQWLLAKYRGGLTLAYRLQS